MYKKIIFYNELLFMRNVNYLCQVWARGSVLFRLCDLKLNLTMIDLSKRIHWSAETFLACSTGWNRLKIIRHFSQALRIKLNGRNYSETVDGCINPKSQVTVTEDLSVLAFFNKWLCVISQKLYLRSARHS